MFTDLIAVSCTAMYFFRSALAGVYLRAMERRLKAPVSLWYLDGLLRCLHCVFFFNGNIRIDDVDQVSHFATDSPNGYGRSLFFSKLASWWMMEGCSLRLLANTSMLILCTQGTFKWN